MLYTKLDPKNPLFTFCVDGRKCIAILCFDRNFGEYTHYKLGKTATKVNGPQFLGGGLMFVAYLMEIYGLPMDVAFDYADMAIRKTGMTPAIHVDTHDSKLANVKWAYPLLPSNVIDMIVNSIRKGCGYADYAFGDLAQLAIGMAIKFGWSILVLDGDHQESKAGLNNHPDYSLDTSAMVDASNMAFNLDITRAMSVLYQLYTILPRDLVMSTMPHESFQIWVLRNYKAVVKSLRNIDELIVHNPLVVQSL